MSKSYIEFIKGSVYSRGEFVPSPDIKITPRNVAAYVSYFLYPEDGMHWILSNTSSRGNTPSAEGYDGSVGIRSIVIDIDMSSASFDVKVAELSRILSIIEVRTGLSQNDIQVYFSGNKGFHIVIPSGFFTKKPYFSKAAFNIVRYMICELCDIPFEQEKMNESHIDFKTIHNTALIRLPLSKHEVSGLYKIPITHLDSLSESSVLLAAKNCDYGVDFSFIKKPASINEELEAIFKDAVSKELELTPSKKEKLTIIDSPSGVKSSVFFVPKAGSRNNDLHRMAYRLYAVRSLTDSEVYDIMKIVLSGCNAEAFTSGIDLITDIEFNKLMISAKQKSIKDFSLEKGAIKNTTDSIMSSFKKITKNIRVKTYVSCIDSVKGGLQIEDFYLAVGNGGTYKSTIWLRSAIKNAEDGVPSLYISGEMSEIQVSSHIVAYKFGIEFEERVKSGVIDENTMSQMSNTLSLLNENLRFIYQANLDEKHIEAAIRDTEKLLQKKVRLVVVDSLGSLEQNGNEIRSLIDYSKGMKEIAKKNGITIIALHHTAQGCSIFHKYPHEFVRGGAKLIDNCDGYFDHSRIQSSTSNGKELDGYVRICGNLRREKDGVTAESIIALSGMEFLSEHEESAFQQATGIALVEKIL